MTDRNEYEHGDPAMRQAEARDAVAHSRQQLEEVLAQGDEVTRITRSLRDLRTRNRFAERMEQSMRRSHA